MQLTKFRSSAGWAEPPKPIPSGDPAPRESSEPPRGIGPGEHPAQGRRYIGGKGSPWSGWWMAETAGLDGSENPVSSHAPPSDQPLWARFRVRWFLTEPGLTLLVIVAFIIVGGYARLVALGAVSEWVDEAQSTLAAFSILQHGYPVVVGGFPYVLNNWEPLYPYLEAVSIITLGHSNLAYRMPSAILGITLIPIAYLAGARLRDRYVGISLAAMVAFSTEYIAWSREARWYMLFIVIMAVGILLFWAWSQSSDPHERRRYLAGLALVFAGLAVTSIGLLLFYVPGLLAGALAYLVTVRWDRIREFFGGPRPPKPSTDHPAHELVPRRYRLWVILLGALAVAAAVLYEWKGIAQLLLPLSTKIATRTPSSSVWIAAYGSYLVDFYAPIVALALGSIYFVARKKEPVEIGLLAFAIGAFAGGSVAEAIFQPLTPGDTVPDRHLLPLLFVLFLFASITIVGVLRWLALRVRLRWPRSWRFQRAVPGICGVMIVAMLVIPSAGLPSHYSLKRNPSETSLDRLLPWVPFSLDPENPWALNQVDQPNYQLAAEYALAHRAPGDVMATTQPWPVSVYYGSAQYFVRANPSAPSWLYPMGGGQYEYYGTNAVWVYNTTQFENLLYNSSGWFVSDIEVAAGAAFPGDMYLIPKYIMTFVPNGSDRSISLFHWNRSTPTGLLEEFAAEFPSLRDFTRNFTQQQLLDWAVTNGVWSFASKDFLIPLTPYLLPLVTDERMRALGTLLYVYNTQPVLQNAFPGVTTPPYNDTALLDWGCSVASGQVSSPLHSILAPYQQSYCR